MSTSPSHIHLAFHLAGTPSDRALGLIADPTQPLYLVARRAVKALAPSNDIDEGPRDAYILVLRTGSIVRAERTAASYGLDPSTTITLQRVPHRTRGEETGVDTADGRFTR